MASASSAIEVPVFIDTSLGTHIAISISPDLTAAEFKRKFESMHSNCYPGIGNIRVDGLMVKRKSYLYHLPESMPIKHAFQGSKGTWFLYTEAYPLNNKISSTPQYEVVHGSLSENKTIKNRRKSKRKKRMRKGSPVMQSDSRAVHHISKRMVANEHRQGSNACSFVEPTSGRQSESISVSGIIKRYFSVNDEVTSTNSKPRVPKYAPKTPPAMTNVRASRDLKKSSGVGKRLIVAANNLGITSSDKKPVISLCKSKCGKSSVLRSSSLGRHPVFELGEG